MIDHKFMIRKVRDEFNRNRKLAWIEQEVVSEASVGDRADAAHHVFTQ